MRLIAALLLIAIAAIAVVFSVLNANSVEVDFYLAQRAFPLSLLLVIALSVGILLGILAGLGLMLKLKRQNAGLKKQIQLSEKEVANLRRLPFRDGNE